MPVKSRRSLTPGGWSRLQTKRIQSRTGLDLLSAILRRVADAVQPLGFQFVQDRLLLPLPDGIGNRLRKLAGLFAQLDNGQINEL
jgi:hypothetical protein